jgi:NitT/TauT family transport system permease protein
MRRAGAIRALVVGGAIAALEAACRLRAVPRATIIPPSEMAAELGRLLASGELRPHLAETLGNVLLALALAAGAGFALGLLLHRLPRLRRLLDPLLVTWYAVPFFVFYPTLIVLFGMNRGAIVAIGFLFAVVAMVVGTLNGLDRIPRVLRKVARVHRLGPLAEALQVSLPSAAPWVFAGLKLSVAYAFVGVIAAEFILSSSGLGYSIAYAYNDFENPRMYALMLLVIALTTTVNSALHAWEGRLRRRRGL